MSKAGIAGIGIIILTGISLAYCQSYTKNVIEENYRIEFAKRNAPDAKNEIAYAGKENNSDFEKFIREANHKIFNNEKSVSELNFETKVTKNDSSVLDSRKISAIGKKNYDLKMKLDYYVEAGKGDWLVFKSDLNNELADLDLAINELKQN